MSIKEPSYSERCKECGLKDNCAWMDCEEKEK